MKAIFRLQKLWENIFYICLITFHIRSGLCRPSKDNVDTQIILLQDNNRIDNIQDAQGHHHTKVRPSYDLINMDDSEYHKMRDDSTTAKDNDTPQLYSDKDLIDFLSSSSNDVDFIEIGNDTSTRDDVHRYVTVDKEGSVLRHRESPFIQRNLVRKRRHPEQHRPHRRRRRKHQRLVLKARNHLSDGKDEFKDRFLIKSDSPGFVITSASEVKKDWCKTIPLKQKISEPNCRSRVIQNNFCYGQCNSFFIPHTSRTDNKVAFQSCAVCKPVRQHYGNVTLNCPGRQPPKLEKTVLFVDTCRCVSEVPR